ncbi:MAG: phosphoenolpyruvate synthase [Deltaproteobacteria bacterium]|nr:phosphoenolpyruvate synthase [Deltaproteobacteria bacterium]
MPSPPPDGATRLRPGDGDALARTARSIRDRIRAAPLPEDLAAQVTAAYEALSPRDGEVAVRASAITEDPAQVPSPRLPDGVIPVRGAGGPSRIDRRRSAAQQGSPSPCGEGPPCGGLFDAIKTCMASLFTDRAIHARHEGGVAHRAAGVAVSVQQLVRSDLASAGEILTFDPASGFREVVEITTAWGFGELVAGGRVDPDALTIHKPTLTQGFRPIVRRRLGTKATKLVLSEAGATREVPVLEADRHRPSLSDDDALVLARWTIAIEDLHAARTGSPAALALEWAKDGRTGELFIVQARTVPAPPRSHGPTYERFRLTGTGRVLVTGRSVGTRIGHGRARVIRDPRELASFVDGEVLVAETIDPDWEPAIARAAAIVNDRGGRTGHAAIVARELGIPCLVGTTTATRTIRTGDEVTVSCAEGTLGHVYAGRVDYERQLVDPATLPTPSVPVMLNVGDPAAAFTHGQLPSAGVGLARIEFMLACVGIHPMALVHPERVRDPATRDELAARTAGLASPTELLVDRLATGISQIAAAFYPRPVIVRFSDLKSDEYADLLGGKDFEPVEANPMIGFRGASRYYHERYREGFALECAAILRVRHVMGLTNVKVMIPFCRTLGEARLVLDELAANGLRRGEAGLEVHVMCEIPNNVVLAAELCELFDGFSIGSNDLTQLVLGVDRDSNLLAHVFDDQDPGVKKLIARIVATAHGRGRPVGFCGQAPSDDPGYAAFLASLGIDSISVTPDALARVIDLLARREGDLELQGQQS